MIAYEKKVGRMCWLVDRDFEMALPFDGPGGEDAWVTLSDGILTVRRGFAWDGLWPLPRLDCGIRASLVHDALYHLMRAGALSWERRRWADEVFRDICLEDGMPEWLAAVCYRVVRLFGGWRKEVRVEAIRG